MTRDLNKYVGLDNRDLKARPLTPRELFFKEFIEAWETAASFKIVCDRFPQKSPSAIKSCAAFLRRKGVPLKKFSRQTLIDFKTLAQIHADLKKP